MHFFFFWIWILSEIWFFGYVENAPRHILTFQFWNLKKSTFFEKCRHFWNCCVIPPPVVFFSGKWRPGHHLTCFFLKMTPPDFLSTYIVNLVDFCRCLSIFVDFLVSQVVPGQNDADDGVGAPTSAMPHSHRQANTHRDQISRSGETPSLWYIYIYIYIYIYT